MADTGSSPGTDAKKSNFLVAVRKGSGKSGSSSNSLMVLSMGREAPEAIMAQSESDGWPVESNVEGA